MADVENIICAVIRGEHPNWPSFGDDSYLPQVFLERGSYHGVQVLLHEHLQKSELPAAILLELRQQAVGAAMRELRGQQLLGHVLAALVTIDVEPVLFKGTALAYSLYSSPVERTRGDTDLIIAADSLASVDAALTGMGYVRDLAVSGEFVSYQASYSQTTVDGSLHTLDLHWRINNSEVLANLFSYEELRTQAQRLPKLSPLAIGAGPVHALLLACMHRATHKQNPYYVDDVAHYGGDRLIWLYDIHLLAGSLDSVQWHEFLRLSEKKGLRAVCLEGMEHTRDYFHTEFPQEVIAALRRASAAELPAIYLGGSRLRQQWMDFRAISGTGNKLRFLRESLFPSEAYIRHKYPEARPSWLPWLYVRRAFGGVAKKLRLSSPPLRKGNLT
jgi:hypothetical protein